MNDVAMRLRCSLEHIEDVRLAYLFGSFARGEPTAGSDVDVAVRFARPNDDAARARVHEALEAAVERPVDLVDADRAPPLLLREILGDGVLLVARDEDERARFELEAIVSWLDTQHLRDIQHHYLRQRALHHDDPTR